MGQSPRVYSEHLVWAIPLIIALVSAVAWFSQELVPKGQERVLKLEFQVEHNTQAIEELKK